MLSSEERRSRLENLLERVRENRNKERVAEPVVAEPLEAVELEEATIEEPEAAVAADDVEREFFDSVPGAAPVALDDFEDEDEIEEFEEELVVEESTPTSVEEAFFDGDSKELVSPYKSEELVEEPEPLEAEEIAEVQELPVTEELAEVEELDEVEELVEVADIQESHKMPEVERFEATATASGDVAVFKGERRPKEWTLTAVLERAWKLGGTE